MLRTALKNTRRRAAKEGVSVYRWLLSFKDPFTVAVVFEDSAAVAGVAIAAAGIALTQWTGNPIFDSMATLCIAGLLATVSIKLIALNRSFILGRVSLEQSKKGKRRGTVHCSKHWKIRFPCPSARGPLPPFFTIFPLTQFCIFSQFSILNFVFFSGPFALIFICSRSMLKFKVMCGR